MITFPIGFTETKYPGYYWDVINQKLYSIKVGGELRELTPSKPNQWNNGFDGYSISHKGQRRYLNLDSLIKMKCVDSELKIKTI